MYSSHKHIESFLKKHGVSPILYGSLGVSVYLGKFKDFDDIDLLIDDQWFNDKWSDLLRIMTQNGFELIDLKEHEFRNSKGIKVAFVGWSVLTRDNICDPFIDPIEIKKEEIIIKTLTPQDFLKAYQFSAKDGYRKEKRGKNDIKVVELLSRYLKLSKS